ncbi:ShlB/FhaC/HecB family hemolysin secretion/activation protein [Allopusillimonas ginsengisoli]|uniref:ShlB/FhaC/HecB family hemolysin secretion/activation protein n=1 Tax=Allopusillimonas ginsengisoli TaxID=453575 RepID=UPI001021AFF8|nr:POTRA domain-containing protein [Allopusillimonas ginsengisoli]TEA80189.1 ShlB/FhaC/HecB family hemolysin secretion/activation protein [Allopusillimonas ginsengisoli]
MRALSTGALAWAVVYAPVSFADGIVRGNPLDSLPKMEVPAARQQPAPQLQMRQADAQAEVQRRLQQTVTPSHFEVAGNSVIPIGDIAPILEPLAGKAMTVAQLVQEVNKITLLYQSRGYALSFALLQNQDFSQGNVRVTVVEGHVSGLRIEGDVGNAGERLQALAKPVIEEKPLTRKTFERQLNLMRMVPGVRFTPTLDMPKRADGATEFVLDATRQRFGLTAGVSDMGTGMQGIVGITANSLTPLGEQTRLTASVPLEKGDVQYFAGKMAIPVGNKGFAVELDGYHYEAEPQDALLKSQGWDREVVNHRIGVGVSYPFILDNKRMLKGSLGVYAAETNDQYHRELDNAWLLQKAKLRVARAELHYRDVGLIQSRDIKLGVYKGVDGMGASKSLTSNYATFQDPNYDLDFTRFTADMKQTLKLPAGFGATLSATGQYTSNILPNMEQVSFGSWRYGLGYEQGELAGDKGYGMSIEVNRRIPTGWRYLAAVQPYVMFDHARAWYNDSNFSSYNDRKLASAALGLRVTDDRNYIFDFNMAKPVGDRPLNDDSRDWRFNANYSLIYDGF